MNMRLTVAAGTATMLASIALYPLLAGGSWVWADIRQRRPGMDAQSLRDLLDGALAGEPPIGPVAHKALAAGIMLRRRRIRPPLR